MKKLVLFRFLCAMTMTSFIMTSSVFADSWKFGVISDTQWTKSDDGKNPNTCAADIIKQVDQQFIAQGVKLVVHVGDMVDTGSQLNDYTRALYAQDLYNAGIGFYPLRGNHEAAHGTYTGSGEDMKHAYPQILPGVTEGLNNDTPADITSALVPAADMDPINGNPPVEKTLGNPFVVGTNFSAPEMVNAETGGVSYAFQYDNAFFILLDQFKSPDYYTSYIPKQQPWMDAVLSTRRANTQAFVFTHKNILGGNHKDNMFGGTVSDKDPGDGYGIDPNTVIPYPDANGNSITVRDKQANMNTFLASMQNNQVKYVISGHDHHHYNSVVTSPDGLSRVHQLITQSDSSKFYTPALPVSPHDVPVEQDLAKIGYYIFTVDGPRVTIDYYADDHADWTGSSPVTTPTLHFTKQSSTGYSLNGKEALFPQGATYSLNDDTSTAVTMESGFFGTSMAILDGTNGSKDQTNYGKATVKAVNTGWAPTESGLASDILTLWGMSDPGVKKADTFVLSMTYSAPPAPGQMRIGAFGIATRTADGAWINAAAMNFGGAIKFVRGSWKPGYGLGTYGIDRDRKTAWAVINYNGEFAVK